MTQKFRILIFDMNVGAPKPFGDFYKYLKSISKHSKTNMKLINDFTCDPSSQTLDLFFL